MEYALAQWWKSIGIGPDIMVGHSIGEYAAACLSGVISLADCIKLVCIRGRLMQGLPSGSMLAVGLPEAELTGQLNNKLSLAVLNGPNGCVISGEDDDIQDFQAQLEEQEIDSTLLKTSHAFHSVMMDPILDQFTDEVSKITLSAPQIPFYSNVSGKLITTQQATDPNYWAKHLRQTVRFVNCVDDLLSEEPKLFLEVGPGNTLAKFVKQNTFYSKDNVVLTSTRHPKDKSSDFQYMLHTIGNLWLSGKSIDWQVLYQNEQRLRIRIPTYCFDRKKYWVGPDPDQYTNELPIGTNNKIKKKPDTSDWLYAPIWKETNNHETLEIDKDEGAWLIFGDREPFFTNFIKKCKTYGIDIVSISFSDKFENADDGSFKIDPGKDHYDGLISKLKSRNLNISKIVHLGNLGEGLSLPEVNEESLNDAQSKGFYSILEIAKALAKNGFNQDLELNIVSNQMQAVTGSDIPHSEKASLVGACKVIPLEYPNITCHSIDFGKLDNIYECVEQLWSEVATSKSELLVSYRGQNRYCYDYDKIEIKDSPPQAKIKPGGVYLITGGLGGMGLVFAEHISKVSETKLLLLGRSAFPERKEWERYLNSNGEQDPVSIKIRKLMSMESNGAQLMISSADVSSHDQMTAIMEEALKEFGKIDGLIHTAGVIDNAGIIHNRSRDATEEVMRAKIHGTLLLDQLLENQKLDFFLLCSSIGTVLYHVKFAQVGYVAANEFLDQYAVQRSRNTGIPTVVINWDDWQEVGMSVVALDNMADKLGESELESILINGILPHEGFDILSKAIHLSIPRLVISTYDLHDRIELDRASIFIDSDDINDSKSSTYDRPSLNNEYEEPLDDIEKELAKIWQELLGIDLIGRTDDFFELGGDSLIAVRMFRSIEKKLGKSIQITSLYDNPTIETIGKIIKTSLDTDEKPQSVQIKRVSRDEY